MRYVPGIFLLILWGCGPIVEPEIHPAPAGIYVETTMYEYLQARSVEVEACSGLKGDFFSLAIAIREPSFPCEWVPGTCTGLFNAPNLITLGSFGPFKHEYIHYLLYINTGSVDSSHVSPLFRVCT